jgi:hypothetical protein
VRLPRIKQIAEKNREGDRRKNPPRYQLGGQAAQRREARDQEQIGKAAEEKAEEAIEVARNEPARSGSIEGWRRASDGRGLAS